MKKKIGLVALVSVILALIITPFTVFADDQENTTAGRPIKDGLAIVAPHTAAIGQEIQMTVFQCSDQTPVDGAGIWAISPEKLESIKGQLRKDDTNDNTEEQDRQYEELLNINGVFLGPTNKDGKLWHTFDKASRYMLVTFKRGYWPDARSIAIGITAIRPQLVIDAPNRAEVNEKITITVTEKGIQDPVKDAGVWAFTREQTESLKAAIAAAKEAQTDEETLAIQIEARLNLNGIFIGTTNGAGKVQYAFDNEGGYLLVTFKRGYMPGFKGILIGNVTKALAIDAPSRADVDEKITIMVTERGTQDPVKDAGVWTFSMENAETLKNELESIKEVSNDAAVRVAIESILNSRGSLLGTTNGAGKLQTSFDTAGNYLVVTYKPGYWPAVKVIRIGSTPQALVIDVTDRAKVGEKITITVFERGTQDAVKDAGVWAVSSNMIESFKTEVAAVREVADTGHAQSQIESIISKYCFFLGTTNGAGKLQATFDTAGAYLLVTYKAGYFPGVKLIVIVRNTPALSIRSTDATLSTDNIRSPVKAVNISSTGSK